MKPSTLNLNRQAGFLVETSVQELCSGVSLRLDSSRLDTPKRELMLTRGLGVFGRKLTPRPWTIVWTRPLSTPREREGEVAAALNLPQVRVLEGHVLEQPGAAVQEPQELHELCPRAAVSAGCWNAKRSTLDHLRLVPARRGGRGQR